MTRKTNKTLKAIDLFCGCGGLSWGLKNAGFDIVAALDLDPLAIETYRMNHKYTLTLQQDIREVSPIKLLKKLKMEKGELDLLAGCPPCQGFSTLRTNNGGKRIDDPMNDLVFEFLHFINELQPKAIMMENVPGLYKDHRLKKFCSELDLMGYSHKVNVLNAVDYGVPQRRHRLILLACKEGDPNFAPPHLKKFTVKHAIGRLSSPKKDGGDPFHDYSVSRSEKVVTLIKRIPKNGGSRTDLSREEQLDCHKKCNGFKDIYGRMAWEKPAPTITGGCINPSKGRFLHPQQDRAITLREAALIQGFPKKYKFSLTKGLYSAAQMIGNAFPPRFAQYHALQIRRVLEDIV